MDALLLCFTLACIVAVTIWGLAWLSGYLGRRRAIRGFEVILKDATTGEAPVLLEKKDDDHG